MHRFVGSLLFLSLYVAAGAFAYELEASTLAGLTKLGVAVHFECPENSLNMSDTEASDFAQQLLKKAGLVPLPPSNSGKAPNLLISFNCMQVPSSKYVAYWIQTGLHERAKLSDRPLVQPSRVCTWHQEISGTQRGPFSKDKVRALIGTAVNEFVRQYKSGNNNKAGL